MPASKLILVLITIFLVAFGTYLIVMGKKIEGVFLSETGWVYSSYSGYFILLLGLGCLGLLAFIILKKKM